MTSSVRYPRLAAFGFLLGVTIVTIAATLGILWLFVPDVATSLVEQGTATVHQVVDFGRTLVSGLTGDRPLP